jgi:curved DNA-binding protein CbpA
MQDTNPFTALGIDPGAEPDEIKRAYIGLARQLHPDSLPQAAAELLALAQEAFAALATAHQKLSEPESLEAYRKDPDRDAKRAAAEQEVRQVLDAERLFKSAEERLEAQDWSSAMSGYQAAVELCPEEGEYRACLAWATYLARGADPNTIQEAIRQAQAAVKLSPRHPRTALVLGRLYQANDQLDRATKMFKRAVHLDPHSVDAVRELRIMRMREERERKKRAGLLSKLLRR